MLEEVGVGFIEVDVVWVGLGPGVRGEGLVDLSDAPTGERFFE